MNTLRRLWGLGPVAIALTTIQGCSAEGSTHEGPGEARQIADGLHTERADAEGLRGSFTQNGTTIYFEAIRGEDNPAEVTADPSAPAYAVDARFFDEDGTSFLVSTGGTRTQRGGLASRELGVQSGAADRGADGRVAAGRGAAERGDAV